MFRLKNMVIEVSAVDLKYVDNTIKSINLLDSVRCISNPHGLNNYFPVVELEIQLDKPDNSTYKLGGDISPSSFTGSTNAIVVEEVARVESSINESINKTIKQSTQGYVTILKNEQGSKLLQFPLI